MRRGLVVALVCVYSAMRMTSWAYFGIGLAETLKCKLLFKYFDNHWLLIGRILRTYMHLGE